MKRIVFFFFITLLLSTCSEVEFLNGVPIRQYASVVLDFSSQLGATNYSANKVISSENVYPNYGANINSWSPFLADGQREYLVVGFDTLQTIHTIEIYETFNPGAIDTIYVRNESTQKLEIVYSKPAQTDLADEARIFTVYIRETSYLVDAIRIAMNSEAVEGRNEIDAIAIGGQRKK